MKEAVDDGGIESMFDKNQRVPNTKSRVDPNIEMDITHYAIEEPAHGQARALMNYVIKAFLYWLVVSVQSGYTTIYLSVIPLPIVKFILQ